MSWLMIVGLIVLGWIFASFVIYWLGFQFQFGLHWSILLLPIAVIVDMWDRLTDWCSYVCCDELKPTTEEIHIINSRCGHTRGGKLCRALIKLAYWCRLGDPGDSRVLNWEHSLIAYRREKVQREQFPY